MKLTYELSEGEIKIAIADYLNRQGVIKTSARGVRLNSYTHYDVLDRPTGAYTVSATVIEI